MNTKFSHIDLIKIQPHKRIHFHIRHQVEAELERLERLDIIEREHRPTHWVPPIVVATKP